MANRRSVYASADKHFLVATYDDHLRLIGKHVVLLVLIERSWLGVTAEAHAS